MNKQQLVDDLLQTSRGSTEGWTNNGLMAKKKDAIQCLWDEEFNEDATGEPDDTEVGEPLSSVLGSKVQESYRQKYARIAEENGRRATTSEGRATLNNGDELALLLEDADPAITCAVADQVLNKANGSTYAQYTTDRIGKTHPKTGAELKPLNDGMVRMNAGNRIRSWVKKHENPADGIAEVEVFLLMALNEQVA